MAALLASAPTPASAAGPNSGRGERERVRQRQAQVAAQVDALRAEDRQVTQALQALEANVATQEASLAGARRAAASAEARLATAQVAEAATAREISRLREATVDLRVRAFVGRSDAVPGLEPILRSGDLDKAVRGRTLVDAVLGDAADLDDRLRAAQEDLTAARQMAEQAATEAREQKAEITGRLDQVKAARDQQAKFADAVDARIESGLAEAASLAQLDQRFADEITRQQQELARRNRAGTGNRSVSVPPAGNVPLRNVRGIWVHESMASELEALLGSASSDGFALGGGGYRNPADQRRLREANCPDPDSSPASSCSPPTARPGQSMHERGLAVDFTYQGRIISSRSSPAYRWLAANAGRFGLKNLPSEPWHWSVNGN